MPGGSDSPAATFGGVDARLVTDDVLRRYWRLRLVNLIGIAVSMVLIATVPIVIATAFAHAEVTDYFGDGVFIALAAMVLLALALCGLELLRMRPYRSLEAFRRRRSGRRELS